MKSRKYKIFFSIASILLVSIIIIILYPEDKTHHFGNTSDSFDKKRSREECCKSVNREGLNDLNASGSAFIFYPELEKQFGDREKKIYVISLLKDELYYYKWHCLRWYGMGYMKDDLGKEILHEKAFKKSLIRFFYGTPPIHDLTQLQTERQIVESLGGEYYLPFKNNQNWLGNLNFVEDMINFFESLPKNAHLYIHCAFGRGRTTTFLVLYDIFRNGKRVSLKDITDRHYCLGRENIMNTTIWANGTWTQEALDARKELIERFYAYMTDPLGYGHQSWTHWRESNGLQKKEITVHITKGKKARGDG